MTMTEIEKARANRTDVDLNKLARELHERYEGLERQFDAAKNAAGVAAVSLASIGLCQDTVAALTCLTNCLEMPPRLVPIFAGAVGTLEGIVSARLEDEIDKEAARAFAEIMMETVVALDLSATKESLKNLKKLTEDKDDDDD